MFGKGLAKAQAWTSPALAWSDLEDLILANDLSQHVRDRLPSPGK
jgi:hypothetical protein